MHSGADGSVLLTFFGDSGSARLGTSSAALGDVDGDGVPDFAITTRAGGVFVTGRITAFSGADGSTLWITWGTQTDALIGFDMDTAGDVDNDGVLDLVVADFGIYPLSNFGRALVLSGVDGSILHQFQGSAAKNYAYSVGPAGDVDSDGFVDYAASATSSAASTGPGYVRVLSGYAAWYDQGQGLAGPGEVPSLVGSGPLTAGSLTTLGLTGGPANSAGILVFGSSSLNLPLLGGVLVPAPDILLGVVTDGSGQLLIGAAWPAAVPAGTKIWCQVWFPGTPGPGDEAASNGLLATTLP